MATPRPPITPRNSVSTTRGLIGFSGTTALSTTRMFCFLSLEVRSVSFIRIQYDVLIRQADQSKLLYNIVLQRMKETDLTSKDKKQNMRVVDSAIVPLNPIKPRVVLTLFLGVIGGLGVAIGLAFFVNYLDDSIKNQDDIETYLRLPFLGYVPNIKTNSVLERDMQAHLHPQSNAAEGFRTIRAAIALAPKSDQYHLLAI